MRPSTRIISTFAVTALAGAAFAGCGSSGSSTKASNEKPAATEQNVAQTTAAPKPVKIAVVVKSDEQRGKKGSDGKWHDAFLPANYTVKAGQKVTMTVTNYDDMPHTFTSPDMQVDVNIPAGSEQKGSTKTFTFKAPADAGSYAWYCNLPCDPWAMTHDGYMRGHVTVTA